MINSLFMLGSAYNRNRKISIGFMLSWITYMFIRQYYLGFTFPVVNAIIFILVTVSINLIKNKKINTILSIFSILIWSVIIDAFCYYMYPLFSSNQTILGYIFQGILFNYRYVFSNIIAICIINAFDIVVCKIKEKYLIKKNGNNLLY